MKVIRLNRHNHQISELNFGFRSWFKKILKYALGNVFIFRFQKNFVVYKKETLSVEDMSNSITDIKNANIKPIFFLTFTGRS